MYSTVSTPYRPYIRDVARAMRKEVEHLAPHDKIRKATEKKSFNLVNCITSVVGYECEECGQPAPASGKLVGTGQRCNARICPRCARKRAAVYRDLGERIQARCTPIIDTWSWKLFTLTAQYDKSDENDLTVEALRARYVGLRASWRSIYSYLEDLATAQGQDRRRVGAMCAVELVGTGFVHLHAIALCPFVDKERLQPLALAGWDGAGTVDVKEVHAESVREVAKYPCKTPGGAGESWIGGSPCFTFDKVTGEEIGGLVHPRLAARWELALSHRRVLDRYGAFRGVPLNEENVIEDPEPLPPCLCGCKTFRKVIQDPRLWISRFTRSGQNALATPQARAKRDGVDYEHRKRKRPERGDAGRKFERECERIAEKIAQGESVAGILGIVGKEEPRSAPEADPHNGRERREGADRFDW